MSEQSKSACMAKGVFDLGGESDLGQLRVILALGGARAVCTQYGFMLRAWLFDLMYSDWLVRQTAEVHVST